MATTTDELRTAYSATIGNAATVPNKIADANERMGQRVTRASGVLRSAVAASMNTFRTMSAFAAGGALVAGGGFLALTRSAIDQATKIETLTATYGALSGSMEIARSKMAFVKNFATSALGSFDDLAEAGTRLEASGLNMERFLPTIANVAGAFGAGRDQILGLSDAFGRLASGSSGEALERLREFGITRAALESKGITFDGGGQLTSGIAEALIAVETIAREKFGNISKYMASTLGQALSNLGDSWRFMLAEWGQAFLPFVNRMIAMVTPFMNFLTQSGVLQQVAANFAASFEAMTQGAQNGGFVRFAALIIATLERVPELLAAVGQFLVNAAKLAAQAFVTAYNTIGQGITDLINGINSGIASLQRTVLSAGATFLESPLGRMIVNGFGAQGFGGAPAPAAAGATGRPGIVQGDFLGGIKGLLGIGSGPLFGPAAPDQAAIMAAAMRASAGAILTPPPQQFQKMGNVGEVFDKILQGSTLGNLKSGIESRADQLVGQYNQFLARPQMPGQGLMDYQNRPMFNGSYVSPTAEQFGGEGSGANGVTNTLVRKLEPLERKSWGGGEMGRIGVTASEISGYVQGRSQTPVIVQANHPGLKSFIEDVAEQVLGSRRRAEAF